MPINFEQLDSSASEENITLLLGRTILLKIVEDSQAKSLLEDELVKKLVSSENLCSEKTINSIDKLVNSQPLSSVDWFFPASFNETVYTMDASATARINNVFAYVDTRSLPEQGQWVTFPIATARTGRKALNRLKAREKDILELEHTIKSSIGLDLLEPTVAQVCPYCNNVLQVGEFKGTQKCRVCGKDVNRSSAKKVPIHQVPEVVRRVWTSGLWFEAYLAKFLRKLNWKTWVKVHIMGASGVPHEIDVLAIKGGNIIVVECKTGKVSRQDVFNFLTKTQDLKVHMGVLALLENLPEPETKDFVKKNRLLHLLEGMKTRKEDQTLSELKSVLLA